MKGDLENIYLSKESIDTPIVGKLSIDGHWLRFHEGLIVQKGALQPKPGWICLQIHKEQNRRDGLPPTNTFSTRAVFNQNQGSSSLGRPLYSIAWKEDVSDSYKKDFPENNKSITENTRHGWLVGDFKHWLAKDGLSFLKEDWGLRYTKKLEVKWGVHDRGEKRDKGFSSVEDSFSASLCIVIQGQQEVLFKEDDDVYRYTQSPGGFILWPSTISHSWRILKKDTRLLTIRWPL